MNPASLGNQATDFVSWLAASRVAATFAAIALFVFVPAPMSRAAIPESEVKRIGAIPLTTELLDKMEKFFTNIRSNAAAKAEFVALSGETRGNPPMTGEEWASLVNTKCPKAIEVFKAVDLPPEDCARAAFAIEAFMWIDGLATPEDKDKLAKSEDKVIAANAAFYAANKSRAEKAWANFGVLGISVDN